MQEYADGSVVKTSLMNDLYQVPPMGEGSTHQVIGKMPKEDSIIVVNGLQYVVLSMDFVRGTFVAKLNGLKEETV